MSTIKTDKGTYIGMEHPHDGRRWECHCARCGSSLEFETCEMCGGEGVDGHDCGEDSCCCMHPDDNITCDACLGRGAWPRCMSSFEWCEAHPLPGRAETKRSTPEWYAVFDTDEA